MNEKKENQARGPTAEKSQRRQKESEPQTSKIEKEQNSTEQFSAVVFIALINPNM